MHEDCLTIRQTTVIIYLTEVYSTSFFWNNNNRFHQTLFCFRHGFMYLFLFRYFELASIAMIVLAFLFLLLLHSITIMVAQVNNTVYKKIVEYEY